MGRVRSYKTNRAGLFSAEPKILNPTMRDKRRGYLDVCLRMGPQKTMIGVHRLVLLAFVGQPPPGHQAAHGNGSPSENSLSNLRWALPRDNMADQIAHGTKALGARQGKAKLDDDKVVMIRLRYSVGDSLNLLSREYGIGKSHLSKIVRGLSWAHAPGPVAKSKTALLDTIPQSSGSGDETEGK